jgi:hypothetical protein
LIEVFSYSFSLCGSVIGPFYEFNDYTNFINLRGRYENIPSTFKPAMGRFFWS